MPDIFKEGKRIPIPRQLSADWGGASQVVVWELYTSGEVAKVPAHEPVFEVDLDRKQIVYGQGEFIPNPPDMKGVDRFQLQMTGDGPDAEPKKFSRSGRFLLRWKDEPAPEPEDFEP